MILVKKTLHADHRSLSLRHVIDNVLPLINLVIPFPKL